MDKAYQTGKDAAQLTHEFAQPSVVCAGDSRGMDPKAQPADRCNRGSITSIFIGFSDRVLHKTGDMMRRLVPWFCNLGPEVPFNQP